MLQPYDSLITQTLCRVLIPWLQLYGLYVLVHGQVSPGGGFVGGVVIGATLLLSLLVYGDGPTSRMITRFATYGEGMGLLLFTAIGILCLLWAGEFLDYGSVRVPGWEGPVRRWTGILLTMVGVYVDVAVVAVAIFYSLSPNNMEPDHD